ncbi:MAG: hypothetical protein QM817_33765 [Archangium sp.]
MAAADARIEALRDAPADAWLVYADELLASGEAARGELIRLQLELNSTADAERRRVLQERERHLLATDATLGGRDAVLARLDAVWRRGFLSRVRSPPWEALRLLFTHPSGRLLDELVLDNPSVALDEQVELVGRVRPKLRVLEVNGDEGGTHFLGPVDCGPALSIETLERAVVVVRTVDLGGRAGRSSPVRSFVLGAHVFPWGALNAWSFPQLERLELTAIVNRPVRAHWTVATEFPQLGDLPRWAAGVAAPGLRQLVLRNFRIGWSAVDLFTALCASVRLEEVDARHCAVDWEVLPRLRALPCRVQLSE